MREFPAGEILELVASPATLIARMEANARYDDELIDDAMKAATQRAFGDHNKRLLGTLGFRSALAMCDRVLEKVTDDSSTTMRQLREALGEYLRRFIDDAKAVTCFSLDAQAAEAYNKPHKGWESVIASYPSAMRDVKESRKCLALGRPTASVFHLMRVMEYGVRSLGRSLNDPRLDPRRNPSWDNILGKCRSEQAKRRQDRCVEWQSDPGFFDNATVTLTAVQHAWRNPTMHVEREYMIEEAREVMDAMRAFMRHLATKLRE
jgi:hypothetical protein